MKINISDDALKYIASQGGFETIRHSNKGWCHTGNVGVPIIHLGKPESNLEDYIEYSINEIIIYIIKEIKLEKDAIDIDIAKLFKWKKLTLEGALVNK